jgi:antitoxin component YwqK of YwqJK toxin-antitoxin module
MSSEQQDVVGACYICLDESQSESPFVNPNPCKCKGTIRIHESCLTQVMDYRKYCGICKTIYARFVDGLATIKEKRFLGIGYELLIEYTIDTNWKKQGLENHYRKRVQYMDINGQLVNPEPVLVKTIPYKDGVIHGILEQLDIVNPIIPRSECIIRQKIPYVNGKVHGLRSVVYSDTIAIIPYLDGLEHGKAIYSFMNGRLAQSANYVNGTIIGQVKSFYEDGSIRSEKHFNDRGQLNGIEKYWSEDGFLRSETIYINGKREGLMKEYFVNGQIKAEINFKSSVKHGLCSKYNLIGVKVEEINYDMGLMTGIYKTWYDDGMPLCEAEYINGLRFGYYKTWHENGMLASETEYINNKRYGVFTEWDNAGNVISVVTYDEDPFEEEEEELFEESDEEEEEEEEPEEEEEDDE